MYEELYNRECTISQSGTATLLDQLGRPESNSGTCNKTELSKRKQKQKNYHKANWPQLKIPQKHKNAEDN